MKMHKARFELAYLDFATHTWILVVVIVVVVFVIVLRVALVVIILLVVVVVVVMMLLLWLLIVCSGAWRISATVSIGDQIGSGGRCCRRRKGQVGHGGH